MNENYVREKNCPLEAFDVNVWGQWGRQTATPPITSTGFVPTDCLFEETGYKSYYLENSSVKQVPQRQQTEEGYDLQQEKWLSVLSTELELEESSPSILHQLTPNQLRPLLQQLLPLLQQQQPQQSSGSSIGVMIK